MDEKNLESTLVRGDGGSSTKIQVGSEIYFINPNVIREGRERRIQQAMIDNTIQELGDAPYEVVAIRSPRIDLTLVTIKGTTGKEKEMNREYFAA